MEGRPHGERLRWELSDIRSELTTEIGRIRPEEMDWAPGEGMKSFRSLLQEIGAMEAVCRHYLTHGDMLVWEAVWNAAGWAGNEGAAAQEVLAGIRAETLAYLDRASEAQLQTPVPLPESWHGYFSAPAVEPEEMVRWIARHEYYHLGQIITYRWILGTIHTSGGRDVWAAGPVFA